MSRIREPNLFSFIEKSKEEDRREKEELSFQEVLNAFRVEKGWRLPAEKVLEIEQVFSRYGPVVARINGRWSDLKGTGRKSVL